MSGLKVLFAGLAVSLAATGFAVAEEAATPAYTLPGSMGGPGSAIRISRGPENVPGPVVREVAPLPGNSAVRVEDVLRDREIARAAAAEARLQAEAQAAALRRERVVVLTYPRRIYHPVKRRGGFRLVVKRPDFYLSLGNGHPGYPAHYPKPEPKADGAGVFAR